MIGAALRQGFDVLGFSGHSFTPFDTSYCMSENGLMEYLDEVSEAKKFFEEEPDAASFFYAPDLKDPAGLRIFTGIEQDLYSGKGAIRNAFGLFNSGHRYGTFDYVIGSTHAFRLTWSELEDRVGSLKDFSEPDIDGVVFWNDGAYIYVDYSPYAVRWSVDNIFGGDPMAFAEAYFRDESRIVAETDCDIVGHFDLLLKFNEKERIFNEKSPRYRKAGESALERIFRDFKAKGLQPTFEVNTGAMAKEYRTEPYPSRDTLRVIRDMGGSFIINSDCHRAEKLDYGFVLAKELLVSEGYRQEIITTPGGEIEIFV